MNAILVTGLEEIDVQSLPKDLPSRITVDISGLEEIGDTLYVKDLELPPNIEVLNDPDEMVVLVSGITVEEIEEEEVEILEEEPEVIERGKREEVEEEAEEAEERES